MTTCTLVLVALLVVDEPTLPGGDIAKRAGAPAGGGYIVLRSVRPERPDRGDEGASRVLAYGLRYDDYGRIVAAVPMIRKSAPVRAIPRTIRSRAREVAGRVVATTSEYADLEHLSLARGRFLTGSDEVRCTNVAVLGEEAARLLFPGEDEDPVGQSIKILDGYYKVVGVLEGRESSLAARPPERSRDRDVFLPLSTCRLRFGERIVPEPPGSAPVEATQISEIIVDVGHEAPVERSVSLIKAAIRPFHPNDDFEISIRTTGRDPDGPR